MSFSGTATGGGTDYSITGSSIKIPKGSVMDSIRVTSQYDGIKEGDETVIITMGNPTNASKGTTQQLTLTIKDEDVTVPKVVSVGVPENGTYARGQSMIFTLNFDESVFVTGTPQLGLTIGNLTTTANYVFGSGSSTIMFSYQIQPGNEDTNGITIGSIFLNGGSIKDFLGTDVNLTLNNVGSTAGVLVDAVAPSGYSITIDHDVINSINQESVSFTFSGAELGSRYRYTFLSTIAGNSVSGSGIISASNEQITGIDLGILAEGSIVLIVNLTDEFGNLGTDVSSFNFKDTSFPSGHSVSIDQDIINSSNQESVSFTFAGAEVGARYNYTFRSSNGVSSFSGMGTIHSSNQQVSGIYLSGLEDGTITLYVELTDSSRNTSPQVTASAIKNTNEVPTASLVSINGTLTVGESLTGAYTYSDADDDVESGSSYKWYRSDDATGTGKTLISGAVNQQYTIQSSDIGKHLSFEVTPNDGKDAGVAVESDLRGPVKVNQYINFTTISNKTYGDGVFTLGDILTDQGLTVKYTASDPTIVSINGNQATILKAGSTSITASQQGDGTRNPATEVVQSLEVTPATLTVTAANHSKVYGQNDPVFTYEVTGFKNGDNESIIQGILSREIGEDVGVYKIQLGSLSAGTNYEVTFTEGAFTITPANQLISWNQDLTLGCNSVNQLTLTAVSNSGLPITYVLGDPSIASIEGNILTIHQAGSTTITATQEGNLNYNAADEVVNILLVSQEGLISQQWEDVLVFDNSSENFVSWQWYRNGSLVSGATKQYYAEDGVLNGTYYVEAKDRNGVVITSCPLSVSGVSYSKSMVLLPNPVAGSQDFKVRLDYSASQLNGAVLSIYDLSGRELSRTETVSQETLMQAPGQPGLYMVILTLSGGNRNSINLLVR